MSDIAVGTRRQYAEQSLKWDTAVASEKSDDELLQRIWNLAEDSLHVIAALAEAEATRDEYRAANESVAVCAAHTSEVTKGDCLVCAVEAANTRAEAAEARVKELEKEYAKWAGRAQVAEGKLEAAAELREAHRAEGSA